ncbi:hypothetical protein LCGC14_1380660, partial [marine sediment metagenome]
MNISNSIRLKSSAPMALMIGALLVTLVMFSLMLKKQSDLINIQADVFVPADSSILNADRDLYQARQAINMIIANRGNTAELEIDREKNTQQVSQGYAKFLGYISDYDDIKSQLPNFDEAFSAWQETSAVLLKTDINDNETNLTRSDYISVNAINNDLPPAFVIKELITNERFGAGITSRNIDSNQANT